MNATKREVDVVILGAGGGGYSAAFFLDRAGLRVVMVDPIGNLGDAVGNSLLFIIVPLFVASRRLFPRLPWIRWDLGPGKDDLATGPHAGLGA